MKKLKKIWLDITNSPHVLFFEPLIKAISEKEEAKFLVTTRPCQQTLELLKQKRFSYEVVGDFHAKTMFGKACGLFFRSFLLWKKMVKHRSQISFSMSHGSPYCSIASKLDGIYNLWTLDGDKAPDVIVPGVKFASKVIIPELVPKQNYVGMGAKPEKIVQYPGLKEEVYLWNFKPNRNYYREIGVVTDKPILLVRPEATMAAYVKENKFLVPLIERLKNDYYIIFMPRTPRQKAFYQRLFNDTIFIPNRALDGPNAIANCSLMIGAGGTMNREAVVLGKKVVSTYREEMLTVDKWLIRNEFMLHSRNPTKRLIDNIVDGEIQTARYPQSDKTFRFFVDLMRNHFD